VPAARANPTLLISWSHTEPGWTDSKTNQRRDAVLRLSATLRGLGIDVELDLHQPGGAADWTRWGPAKINSSDFVLIVGSPAWSRAWQGTGDPTRGAGAAAEADVLKSLYNQDREAFRRKVRLVFLPGTAVEVPPGLDGVERYHLEAVTPDGLAALLRDLSGQPAFPKQPLGQLPTLPPDVGWRDGLDKPAGVEGRLEAELGAYPTPGSANTPKDPWSAERDQTADRLQALHSFTGDAGTELRYRQLLGSMPVRWRKEWAQRDSSSRATIAVHVLPYQPAPLSARRLAALSESMLKQLKTTGLFDEADALSKSDDADSITVTAPHDERYLHQQVRPGRLQGVRIDGSGQVSAWHSLPADGLGSALDRPSATDAIKDCLLLAGAAGAIPDGDVALAVEVSPITMLSLVDVTTLGQRNTATLQSFGPNEVRVEPDELVEARALRGGAEEAAKTLSGLLFRSWEQRR
jgi:hypothetical protein